MTRHVVLCASVFALVGCLDTDLSDELNWPDGAPARDGAPVLDGAPDLDGRPGGETGPPIDGGPCFWCAPDAGDAATDTVAPWLVPAAGCTPAESLEGPLCLSSGPVGLALRLWASEPVTATARVEPGGIEMRADALAPAHHLLLAPLPPDSACEIVVEVTDAAGLVAAEGPVQARTAPLVAPLVISEVLFDPLGEEPTQEFVELRNLGSADLDLTGWTIADEAGSDVLAPPGPLRAGGYAVVVADGYEPGAGGDPPPAAGALMIVLGGSIGSQGLRNAGEALTLSDSTGQVVASFPAPLDQPHPGTSVERVAAHAPDGDPEAWKPNVAGRSTPGGPNSVATDG